MESHDEMRTTSIYKEAFVYATELLSKTTAVSKIRFNLMKESLITELSYVRRTTDRKIISIKLLAYEDAEKEHKLMSLIRGNTK